MGKSIPRYTKEFKLSLVSLYRNGKFQAQLCTEFGVFQSALGKWLKRFSEEEHMNDLTLTLKQFQEQQKRIARLEEENLKKPLPFTPHQRNGSRLFISCVTNKAS